MTGRDCCENENVSSLDAFFFVSARATLLELTYSRCVMVVGNLVVYRLASECRSVLIRRERRKKAKDETTRLDSL